MTVLLDQLQRPLHDVRISVLDRCNFRCPYCMPEAKFPSDYAFLPKSRWLSDAQWLKTVRVLQQLGMRKLRITGGEPLLRKGLPALIAQFRAQAEQLGLPLEIALTTNASQLAAQADALKNAGLNRLTISLDSLNPERFKQLSGGKGELSEVLAGLEQAQAAGFAPIKINCVVQKSVNEDEILALCGYFKNPRFILRFIEFMDVGNQNAWHPGKVVPNAALIARIHAKFPLAPVVSGESSASGDVAERYRYLDGSAELGFISSISKPFCRSCSRARISAEGKLYTCLFTQVGHDLRAAIESEGDLPLTAQLSAIWRARADRYSELRAKTAAISTTAAAEPKKMEMYHLGG